MYLVKAQCSELNQRKSVLIKNYLWPRNEKLFINKKPHLFLSIKGRKTKQKQFFLRKLLCSLCVGVIASGLKEKLGQVFS